MVGEWLFPVPGAASQSQGTELTAHKTGEPRPKLPEGTGDMVGTRGLWAAQGIRDTGFGSTSVVCNAIWAIIHLGNYSKYHWKKLHPSQPSLYCGVSWGVRP